MKELTPAQTRVLDFVRLFMTANGYPPTRAEIGKSLGFNPNAAQEHLAAIQRKGFIRLVRGVARGIQLAAMPTEQMSMMDVLANTVQPLRRPTLGLK
jgi:repressor LexA